MNSYLEEARDEKTTLASIPSLVRSLPGISFPLPIVLGCAIAIFRQPDSGEPRYLLERLDPSPCLIDGAGSGKDLMDWALLLIFVCVRKMLIKSYTQKMGRRVQEI
jgi:hypothetical protein